MRREDIKLAVLVSLLIVTVVMFGFALKTGIKMENQIRAEEQAVRVALIKYLENNDGR